MNAPVRFPPLSSTRVEPPQLDPGEVHLWSSRLDLAPDRVARLTSMLSDTERGRAERYRFDRHRRRYATSWGLTRVLLGAYAGTAPRQLRFSYGGTGRPNLERPATDLQFNLSHSGDHFVLAVSRHRPLGVDIECFRSLDEARSIARRFFSDQENDSLEALPAADYLSGFFNCWTRKEALVKALGEGVFASLRRFDVTLVPGEAAQLLAVDGTRQAARQWLLFHLEPAPGIVGALATRSPDPLTVRGWTLEPDRQAVPGID